MVLGVVCEYNPFHRGHLYHLRESRRAAGEDSALEDNAGSGYLLERWSGLFEEQLKAMGEMEE